MSESNNTSSNSSPTSPDAARDASVASTAGNILKSARQAQGLHIGVLAATMKVSQQKLEALEADRYDQLPDATFTRALAQSLCRTLKIDPAPVLSRLPQLGGYRIEHLGEGINAPFRERPGHHEPKDWSISATPGIWGALLLIGAAAVVYFIPQRWLPAFATKSPDSSPATAATTSSVVSPVVNPSTSAVIGDTVPATVVAEAATPPSASAPVSAAETSSGPPAVPPAISQSSILQGAASGIAATTPTVTASPMQGSSSSNTSPSIAAAASGAAPSGSASLQLRAKADSWVEVQDARGQVLITRQLKPGEEVSLDGTPPMRLKVGNAAGTEAVFRGQPIDLVGTTRDNVARLELK